MRHCWRYGVRGHASGGKRQLFSRNAREGPLLKSRPLAWQPWRDAEVNWSECLSMNANRNAATSSDANWRDSKRWPKRSTLSNPADFSKYQALLRAIRDGEPFRWNARRRRDRLVISASVSRPYAGFRNV